MPQCFLAILDLTVAANGKCARTAPLTQHGQHSHFYPGKSVILRNGGPGLRRLENFYLRKFILQALLEILTGPKAANEKDGLHPTPPVFRLGGLLQLNLAHLFAHQGLNILN